MKCITDSGKLKLQEAGETQPCYDETPCFRQWLGGGGGRFQFGRCDPYNLGLTISFAAHHMFHLAAPWSPKNMRQANNPEASGKGPLPFSSCAFLLSDQVGRSRITFQEAMEEGGGGGR